MIPPATLAPLSALVKSFEGFSATPYRCPAGVPTIGYGSIWDWRTSPKSRVTMDTAPILEPQAAAWMANEFAGIEADLQRVVKVPMTDNQHAALLSFTYNLGVGNLRASTLLRKLNAGDYAGAAAEFPKWCMGGGKKLAGLVRRREAERQLFLS